VGGAAFSRSTSHGILLHVLRASYSCLLKMTLIHKKEPGNLERKFGEFQTFVSTQIAATWPGSPTWRCTISRVLSGSFYRCSRLWRSKMPKRLCGRLHGISCCCACRNFFCGQHSSHG